MSQIVITSLHVFNFHWEELRCKEEARIGEAPNKYTRRVQPQFPHSVAKQGHLCTLKNVFGFKKQQQKQFPLVLKDKLSLYNQRCVLFLLTNLNCLNCAGMLS